MWKVLPIATKKNMQQQKKNRNDKKKNTFQKLQHFNITEKVGTNSCFRERRTKSIQSEIGHCDTKLPGMLWLDVQSWYW